MKNTVLYLAIVLTSCSPNINDVNDKIEAYKKLRKNCMELTESIDEESQQSDKLLGWRKAYEIHQESALALIEESDKLLDAIFLPTGEIHEKTVEALTKNTNSLEFRVREIKKLYKTLELLSSNQKPSVCAEGFYN
jgi:prefoldin subunit 5